VTIGPFCNASRNFCVGDRVGRPGDCFLARAGQRVGERFGRYTAEFGVALGANDDEAARRLRVIVARRGEILEVDQQRLRGDVGAVRAFDPYR